MFRVPTSILAAGLIVLSFNVPAQVLTTIAGTLDVQENVPSRNVAESLDQITVTSDGAIFGVARERIRRIDPDTGLIATVHQAEDRIETLGVAPTGELYYTLFSGGLYRVSTDGQLEQIIGSSQCDPDGFDDIIGADGPISQVSLCRLFQMEIEADGSPLLGTSFDGVFRLRPDGLLVRIAGGGTVSDADGIPAVDANIRVSDMALDSEGRLLIASRKTVNLIDDNGNINILSGQSPTATPIGTPADQAGYSRILGMDIDPLGNIFIADNLENRVVKIDANTNLIRKIAGSGVALGIEDGDGGSARDAQLAGPSGLAYDPANDDLIIEQANSRKLRRVDLGVDIIDSVTNEPGPRVCTESSQTPLYRPESIQAGTDGLIYLLDLSSALIAIDQRLGSFNVVAGVNGMPGDDGDGGPANKALIQVPDQFVQPFSRHLEIDSLGNLYLYQVGEDERVRVIDSETKVIDTHARLNGPARAFAIEPGGSVVYAFEDAQSRMGLIRHENGGESNVAGFGTVRATDGVAASQADFGALDEVVADRNGVLYIVSWDEEQAHVFRLPPNGSQLEELRTLNSRYPEIAVHPDGLWLDLNLVDTKQTERIDLVTGERTIITGATGVFDLFFSEDPQEIEMHGESLSISADGTLYLIDTRPDTRMPGGGQTLVRRIGDAPADTVTFGSVSQFGGAVATEGEWLAIGSTEPSEFGDEGFVAIYRRSGCRIELTQIITLPDGFQAEDFGRGIAFGDNFLAISARKSGEGKGGENSYQVGIYQLINQIWSFFDDVTPSDLIDQKDFGASLATDGNTLAVGAPSEMAGDGVASIFTVGNNSATETDRVEAGSDRVGFGRSIALSGSLLAIGSDAAQDQDGREVVDLFPFPPSSKGGGVGQVVAPTAGIDFGAALALSGKNLFIGSPSANNNQGRVFAYPADTSGIGSQTIVDSPAPASGAQFGRSVAFADDALIVGAPGAPTSSGGTGMVFVYSVDDDPTSKTSLELLLSRAAQKSQAGFGSAISAAAGRILLGAPTSNSGQGDFGLSDAVPNPGLMSGLWFDPELDGEGFNVIVGDQGIIAYYYGYSSDGERLWLISDLIDREILYEKDLHAAMFELSGGTFANPAPPAQALKRWGTVSLAFTSLLSAQFALDGNDGQKFSGGIQLAGASDAGGPFSGLWFDPALDGEGYNLIQSPFGLIVYFYGYTQSGERLWLVSDLIADELGQGEISAEMFEAVGGTFNSPAASSDALRSWGTVSLTFDDCNAGQFRIEGTDGNKTSQVVKLAGIRQNSCAN